MCVKGAGISGQTRVDVNLDGVSLWLMDAAKPYLMASESSLCTEVSDLDVSEALAGQVMTVDVDQAADGALDLDIFVYTSS
jgi:hypothetical protein